MTAEQQESTSRQGAEPLQEPRFIVGIGASAGGLAAIQRFIESIPDDTGLAFVLIQHLSPNYKSLMAEILAKHTDLPIHTAADGVRIEPDSVYLTSPRIDLHIEGGRLRHHPRDTSNPLHHPIDLFMESLAQDQGDRAIAVILSGTGTDGTHGIRAVKNCGGLVVVQDGSAEFDGMPRSAMATGLADYVLPPEAMGERILAYAGGGDAPVTSPIRPEQASLVKRMLEELKQRTGMDFRQYRRSTLTRRIEKRMRMLQIHDAEDYYEHFARDEGEALALSRELLIGVTSFFRDPEAFECVTKRAIIPLCEQADPTATLRVWVPGCSTGEEAYSLAILLDQHLTKSGSSADFRVFATDIDEVALRRASSGQYSSRAGVPEEFAGYLQESDLQYAISPRIRRRVVFARHDVTVDPPFTRMDLVSCRNLLIYQEKDLQRTVLSTLHFALRPNGYLFLGISESLGESEAGFDTVNAEYRIHRKRHLSRLPLNGMATKRLGTERRPPTAIPTNPLIEVADELWSALLTVRGDTALVVELGGDIVHVIGDPSNVLRIPEGEPTRKLRRLLRSELRVVVSNLLTRTAQDKDTPLSCTGVRLQGAGDAPDTTVDITARLLTGRVGGAQLAVLVFSIRKAAQQATDSFEPDAEAAQRITNLERDLCETREHLQTTIQELESANEELQSTNEELIASNEELQSTNEELHSVNEELHTVNAEHQRKLAEQELLTSDMEHLFKTADIGTIFLDAELHVRKYTPAVTDIIPLMPQDIGRPAAHLRHELVDIELIDVARDVFASGTGTEQQIKTHHGKWLLMRMVPYRDLTDTLSGVVVSFVDVTAFREARDSLAESEARFRQIAENISEVIWVRDPETLELLYLSPAFDGIWGRPVAAMDGDLRPWVADIHEEDRPRFERELAGGFSQGNFDIEYRIKRPDGHVRWIRDRAFPIRDEAGNLIRVGGLAEDVTQRKENETKLRETAAALDELASRDPLTGLANRRGFERTLTQELCRAQRGGERLVALLADCDDFKTVNDTFGHAVGDVVLREIAKRLTRALRPTDCLARVGGDEFLALLPGTRIAEAMQVAERLRLSVTGSPLRVSERTVPVTASFGVALVPEDAMSIEELLVGLRDALMLSKHNGKNRIATDGGVHTQEDEQAPVLEEIKAGGAVRVFAQGIHALDDDARIVGYELLSRGPVGALESPTALFRASIENNILTLIDLQCLKACVEAIRNLPPRSDGWPRSYHLNLYPSTLLDVPMERLEQLLGSVPDTHSCCLELSEQQFIGEPTYLLDAVDGLRSLGMRVAIDDVGFGHSSLESLVVLEPDVIKLDRSLVHGCADDRAKRRCLERLLRVARTLSADVVAEGVENEPEHQVLRELGVEYGQGFLWERPQPFGVGA